MTPWIRSALTDDMGAFDVAYVSLFGVGMMVIGAIPFMCLLSLIAFVRCSPMVVQSTVVACTYDPQPLGVAVGAACGGFATAVGALGVYMAATRKPAPAATAPVAAVTVNAQGGSS